MVLIGITGTDGSGKGTVVDYLVKNKGFSHYSARAYITEEIRRRGLPVDRNHMRLVANDLRRLYGRDQIVRHLLDQAKIAGNQCVVVESIRECTAAELLKNEGGVLLAVDADQKIRYERVQERRSESDRVSFEQFVEHEALEMNDPDPYGMQKQKVIEMADYVIENNGTVEELERKIEAILTKIM